jgi:alpha-1,2-mannosyltransferase
MLSVIGTHRTFPTWNILAYNAIGGSGDELYGVEPASYYVRNLTLNMSISWPLAVVAPILLLREILYSLGNISKETFRTGVLILPSMLWLGILFSRPHKVLDEPVSYTHTLYVSFELLNPQLNF